MRAQHLHAGFYGVEPDPGIRLFRFDLAAGNLDGVFGVCLDMGKNPTIFCNRLCEVASRTSL